jgi:hypothetical protein
VGISATTRQDGVVEISATINLDTGEYWTTISNYASGYFATIIRNTAGIVATINKHTSEYFSNS